MKRIFAFGLIISNIFLSSDLFAQDYSDPIFSSFKGKMYKLPLIKQKTKHGTKVGVQEYFSDTVFSYRVLEEEVEFETFNVAEQDSRDGFPGYEQYKTQFGFVLESSVTIKETACFEFSLNSDDGSRLWIDDALVVNNDGSHGMKVKKDSIVLNQGTYGAQLWYFQGYPVKMGFIFDSRAVGPPSACPVKDEITASKSLVPENNFFFEVNESAFRPEAEKEIEQIILGFGGKIPKTISVIGHADAKGSADHNQKLSLLRANNIIDLLRTQEALSETTFKALGKGATVPIADNTTVYGRQQNRRVELIVEF